MEWAILPDMIDKMTLDDTPKEPELDILPDMIDKMTLDDTPKEPELDILPDMIDKMTLDDTSQEPDWDIIEHIASVTPKEYEFMLALTCKRLYTIIRAKRDRRGDSAWVTRIPRYPSIKYMYFVLNSSINNYLSSILHTLSARYAVMGTNHLYVNGNFQTYCAYDEHDIVKYNNHLAILVAIFMLSFNYEYYVKDTTVGTSLGTHYDFAGYLCGRNYKNKLWCAENMYNGIVMICIACECESYELADYLYSYKTNTADNIKKCLTYMLITSIEYGYTIAFKWALDKINTDNIELVQAPINSQNRFLKIIQKIAIYGHLEMVDYLIQIYGLDNIPDNIYYKTLYMYAHHQYQEYYNIAKNIFKIINNHIEIYERQCTKRLYTSAICCDWIGKPIKDFRLFHLLFEYKMPFDIQYINEYMDRHRYNASYKAELYALLLSVSLESCDGTA